MYINNYQIHSWEINVVLMIFFRQYSKSINLTAILGCPYLNALRINKQCS